MRIGELSKHTGFAAHTIRFYESKGLLPKPKRGMNGYRTYSQKSIQVLSYIQTAQRLGFTLEEIHSLLGEKASGEGVDNDQLQRYLDVRLAEVNLQLDKLALQKAKIIEFKGCIEVHGQQGNCTHAS